MLALYYKVDCPYCLRIRLLLSEKQMPFRRLVVEKDKPAELMKLSGGRVPVLLEDSLAVRESSIIAEYLEERFPLPALLPSEPRERATVRMAMADIDKELMTPVEELAHHPKDDGEAAKKTIADGFARFNPSLGDLGKLFGMDVSLADIWLFSAAEAASLLGIDVGAAGPRLKSWLDRMRNRKSAREERLGHNG